MSSRVAPFEALSHLGQSRDQEVPALPEGWAPRGGSQAGSLALLHPESSFTSLRFLATSWNDFPMASCGIARTTWRP